MTQDETSDGAAAGTGSQDTTPATKAEAKPDLGDIDEGAMPDAGDSADTARTPMPKGPTNDSPS